MNLHGSLYKGHGRRLLAATAVMALGLVMGAGPSMAGDTVPAPAVTEVTAPATTDATAPPATTDVTGPPATTDVTAPPAVTNVSGPPATTDVTAPPVSTSTTSTTTSTKTSTKTATNRLAPALVLAAVPANSRLMGGFEIDGDMTQATMTPSGVDWSNTPYVTFADGATDATGVKGKETDPPSTWTRSNVTTAKADFVHARLASRLVGADQWLYVGLDRVGTTGTVYYAIEFNQLANVTNGYGLSVPQRSVGDLRVSFVQNGNDPLGLQSVSKWNGTLWLDNLNWDHGAIFGLSNPGSITDPAGGTLLGGQFAELAINLASQGFVSGCENSAYTQVNFRSRVSASNSSDMEDIAGPLNVQVEPRCAFLNIHKTGPTPATSLPGATFRITPNPATGTGSLLITDGTTPGMTGAVADGAADGTIALKTDHFSPPPYTIQEVKAPTGYLLDPDTGTWTATPFSTTSLSFNDPLGGASWQKVDAVTGGRIEGATFTLTGTGPNGASVTRTVTDNGAGDTNSVAGAVSVSGLYTGTWTITETSAPAGYLLPDGTANQPTSQEVTVSDAHPEPAASKPFMDVPKTHLTLVKTVSNTFGGTSVVDDWTLTATGITSVVTGKTGVAAVTRAVVSPGAYTLSESGGPSGYAGTWSCSGATLGANDQVTVTVGQSAICTVNNADLAAHLTLVKIVQNVFGGTSIDRDWILSATGPTPMVTGRTGITGITGALAVTSAPVAAGTYTLSESGPGGYAGTWSCPGATLTAPDQVTLVLGETVTCTITNRDRPAHLTLVKDVHNVHGGGLAPAAWTLTARRVVTAPAIAAVLSGDGRASGDLPAGTYTLSESGPAGYAASAWACEGGTLDGARLTLALDQTATCTITNSDRPAHLTLVKDVVNVNGGTAPATAWTLKADGPTPMSGVTGTTGAVTAGTYTLSEMGPAGYAASAWVCGDVALQGSTLTLALDQTVTCTITNRGLPTHLTLVKKVVNGHGGTAVATDWTLSAVGPVTITGTSGLPAVTGAALPAGDFKLSEASGPTGYTASGWVCVGGTLNGGTLTMALAQSATCTITNTQDAPPVVAGIVEDAPVVAGIVQDAPAVAGTLAFTGAETVPLGLSGLLMLVLGAALTVAVRRQDGKRARE